VSGAPSPLTSALGGRRGPRSARRRSAPAGIGAEPVRRGIGVAFLDSYIINGYSEFFGDDLRVGCFVSLTLGFGAESRDGFPRWVDANLGAVEHLQSQDVEALRWARSDYLGEAADADSHQLAALALFRLLLSEFRIS